MYQNIFFERQKNLMHIWDDQNGYFTSPYRKYAYTKDPNGGYVSIYGDKLRMIHRWEKDETDALFESDVPETTRVLVDTYDSDIPSTGHCVMFFDIEIEMLSGLPNTETAKNEITAISTYDGITKTYDVFVLSKGRYNHTADKLSIGNCDVIVHTYDNEMNLLMGFLDYYEGVAPTILTGWNVDYFDIPYLYNRLKRVCGERHANRLSPIGKVIYSQYRERWSIAGVSVTDYMGLYKNYTYSEESAYTLDYIATKEIGRGKVEYDGNLDELFKTDLQKFIEYNLTDVELVVALDAKLQYIELCRAICHAGYVPYEDYMFSSKYLEGACLAYLKKRGLVAPNKPKDRQKNMQALKDNNQKKFIGAYVKEPIVGKYDWLYDLDLTSLYPSIIMSLNISPETKVGKISNWDPEGWVTQIVDKYQLVSVGGAVYDYTKEELKDVLTSNNLAVSANGVVYTQETPGVIADILDSWFTQRVQFRELESKYAKSGDTEKFEFYAKRQLVQKILLNSMYGCLGLPAWRFYDRDNAEAVTISGRLVINKTADMANIKYNKELGGNPLMVYFDDGTMVDYYPNTIVEVIHNGNVRNTLVSKLNEGDSIQSKQIKRIVKQECAVDELGRCDYNIYIDTDSLFLQALPLIKHRYANWQTFDENRMASEVDSIAEEMQIFLNAFYDILADKFFFIPKGKHRFQIKKEYISRAGFWVAKKRYAQWMVLKNGMPCDKLEVKGLDVVRSSFPKSFQEFMAELLMDILKGSDNEYVNTAILNFKGNLIKLPVSKIAKGGAIKELSKYDDGSWVKDGGIAIASFQKSTPAHVKAGIAYNRLLKFFECPYKYEPIRDGDKVKYVYLKTNPLGISEVAFRNYNDPVEIMEFIETHIDRDKLYTAELENKINDFFNALKWNKPAAAEQTAKKFFSF
jgi:DNA polymerase elongation subunit (family B)